MLHIDPLDYKLAVILARARVKDSESRLKVAEEVIRRIEHAALEVIEEADSRRSETDQVSS
jgi:hypothetical protein